MRRVLIVEDDPYIRESLAELLEDEGYDVAQAENGLDALRQVRERRPDLILLDLMMPVMNGWEFRAEQLRDPELAKIPVIVLSAGGPPAIADRFIEKPFELDRLLAEVDRFAVAG